MNKNTKSITLPPEAEALATQALVSFRTRAFWNWPKETQPSSKNLPTIIKRLRQHGGHRGYKIAGKLSELTQNRTCH